jgi:hypothetical protein
VQVFRGKWCETDIAAKEYLAVNDGETEFSAGSEPTEAARQRAKVCEGEGGGGGGRAKVRGGRGGGWRGKGGGGRGVWCWSMAMPLEWHRSYLGSVLAVNQQQQPGRGHSAWGGGGVQRGSGVSARQGHGCTGEAEPRMTPCTLILNLPLTCFPSTAECAL